MSWISDPLERLNAALGDAACMDEREQREDKHASFEPHGNAKVEKGVKLLPTSKLPDMLRTVFKFEFFNPVQSTCFDSLYNSDSNVVVAAPTGAGKTALMEIAIARAYLNLKHGCKIIYVSPTRALCYERCNDWAIRLRHLDINCGLITGANETNDDIALVRNSDLVVTTPEKWDAITRKWKSKTLAEIVKLVLVDEVHSLRDSRGSVLEVIAARMRAVCKDVRFVALSATIPNAEDIAMWLCNIDSTAAKLHKFGDNFRPVPLERQVLGYKTFGNPFQSDKTFNTRLPEIIKKYGEEKPLIVFCATRGLCVSTANYIAQFCSNLLGKVSPDGLKFRDKELFKVSRTGVTFHHAGLDNQDRQLVEHAFINGSTKVICCTSTLAIGVNLPAHTVIIKGTQTWSGDGMTDYTESSIHQMLGRAGRPQFDKAGKGIIMTDMNNKDRFNRILDGSEIVESCLHENLLEHLAVEVALGTVDDVSSAIFWLRSTFFYFRVLRNPAHYGIKSIHQFSVDVALEKYCRENLSLLVEQNVIEEKDGRYVATGEGQALSKYYISLKTLQVVDESGNNMTMDDVILTVCRAREFADARLKHNEKRFYKAMNNLAGIKFRIPTNNFDTAAKMSVICQNELSGSQMPEYNGAAKLQSSYNQDQRLFFKHAPRILRFMIDCYSHRQDGRTLKNLLELSNSINAKCWKDTPLEIRQLEGMGLAYVRKLATRNIGGIRDLEKLSHHDIDHYLSAGIGKGKKILNDAKAIPRLKIAVKATKTILTVALSCANPTAWWHKRYLFAQVIIVNETGDLLDYRQVPVEKLDVPLEYKVSVADMDGLAVDCFAHVTNIVGVSSDYTCTLVPGTKKADFSSDTSGTPIKKCSHRCKNKRKCSHVCCKLHLTNQSKSFENKSYESKKRHVEELLDGDGDGDDVSMFQLPKIPKTLTTSTIKRNTHDQRDEFDDTSGLSGAPSLPLPPPNNPTVVVDSDLSMDSDIEDDATFLHALKDMKPLSEACSSIQQGEQESSADLTIMDKSEPATPIFNTTASTQFPSTKKIIAVEPIVRCDESQHFDDDELLRLLGSDVELV